ncbi:ABC-type branched-subunit amino acid transport system substrate-binding protein [Streptomyces puniciscabiei]|uniref:ABC-type branched-subunit amino acid transport system substrate-binding protein n=1 Tax=Streptomyces puniciscabiei TaxID=164348 RepID=A0A542UGQ3_9ACTN|nr:ABC transporter substrate-binding protein [Streptomyces puniciscabiei]TQK98270.1 ABC-type branched-subunit amino acid transport system substrate-binding protein [Streptomyces puniciscabiei]
MTGRRRTFRIFLHRSSRPGRATALTAGAVALCASLTAGCGVIPGATGGSGGDPVKVMTWAPQDTDATNKPGMPAMALAYAKWINAHGGINGRKLQVLTCNDHNDSVGAAKCARYAADENVVAVVGSYSQFTDSYSAPLEGAGIPYIGGYGVTNDEFTGQMSYPVNGGQPALLAGLGKALAGACGNIALVRPDSIAGDELPVLLDSGLKAGGHAKAGDQLAQEDATEYGDQADQALRYAVKDVTRKGCVVPALGDRTDTFMDSFRRERESFPSVRLATVLGSVDQTVINATGGASGPYEGAYITGWYPPASDSRWDPMKKVINEEAFGDTRIDPADTGVQTTWIAYTVLKAVLDKIGTGDVTADSVRRTLDDGLRVSTGGLTPTLHWTYAGPLASVGFPRMVNADVTLQVVQDGRLVAARKGVGGLDGTTDMTRTLENADVQ